MSYIRQEVRRLRKELYGNIQYIFTRWLLSIRVNAPRPVWIKHLSVWLMIAYIALFSALLSRLTALACDSTRVTSFFFSAFFWISTEVVYLQRWHGWCHMKLQPSRRKFCVHHTTMLHVTSCKATYVRYLLRATAVTRGWNGYRNKSQHRKSTLEKKILPPFLRGFELATFQSRVRRSNHWAIPYHTVWHFMLA